MSLEQEQIPSTGWIGLKENWKSDIIAAISVALVAMPLSLAIAIAMGIPPISGLITAAIGGVVTTFFKTSPLTISGPGAGLIGVVLAAILSLDDGCGPMKAFEYALAAFIIAGALQVAIGAMRYGRIADVFPTTVIHGILASIGIIIFAKQVHVAMGTASTGKNTIAILQDIFSKVGDANPYIVIISGLGLLLLLFHSKISYKVFHFIPAPVWVLIIAVPIVLFYTYLETNQVVVFGEVFKAPNEYLISVHENWMDEIPFPDFAKAHTGTFWLAVISITLLSSVITLAGTKAVDKLDPHKRKSNLNRDLMAVGFGTIASSAVGGVPVIAVIVRSTVNVHNNAKTKWSNLYHGLIIALFVLLLIPVMQLFPKAALAAVLIVTGIKLASPRLFREIYDQGLEQMVFFLSTIIITLYKDPLSGIIGGMGITLLTHLLISRMSITNFIQALFKSRSDIELEEDGTYSFKIYGIANFLLMLRLSAQLEKVPPGAVLKIDLSESRLVDLTFQEKLLEFRREQRVSGGRVQIIGLEKHIATSAHRLAMKSLVLPLNQKMTTRQIAIKGLAENREWNYAREEHAETSDLYEFSFFKSRPLETKRNILSSVYNSSNVDWEMGDIVFDEGAMLSKEVFKTTIQLVHLEKEIPTFVLEYEGIFDKLIDRVFAMSGTKDIDFEEYPTFSGRYRLTGSDEENVRKFFTPEIIKFLENSTSFHIESNGNSIIVFKTLKNAKLEEIDEIVLFSEGLTKLILQDSKHNNGTN